MTKQTVTIPLDQWERVRKAAEIVYYRAIAGGDAWTMGMSSDLDPVQPDPVPTVGSLLKQLQEVLGASDVIVTVSVKENGNG